jgi:hypothetical protein
MTDTVDGPDATQRPSWAQPLPERSPSAPQRAVPQRAETERVETRKRPDPRPMRLAYGAGALAALSVMSVGLVRFAPGNATTEVTASDATAAALPPIEVRHVIRYIHLKPGEVAPPGAKVITPKAPAPEVVVTHVAAPAAPPSVRRIVVTRQSGRP